MKKVTYDKYTHKYTHMNDNDFNEPCPLCGHTWEFHFKSLSTAITNRTQFFQYDSIPCVHVESPYTDECHCFYILDCIGEEH